MSPTDDRPSFSQRREQYAAWAQRLRERPAEIRAEVDVAPEPPVVETDEWSPERLFDYSRGLAETETVVDEA